MKVEAITSEQSFHFDRWSGEILNSPSPSVRKADLTELTQYLPDAIYTFSLCLRLTVREFLDRVTEGEIFIFARLSSRITRT